MDNPTTNDDDLRPEYEASIFQGATLGKYTERFKSGTNIVKLAPDVAAAFPDEQSVDKALRFVMQLAVDATRLTGR